MTVRRVYLDQNHWVRLARGRTGADSAASPLFDALIQLRGSGQFEFVLSATNYLETWHRSDLASRSDLAETMQQLSRWSTIAPMHTITEWEIDRALFVGPSFGAEQVFGVGANHAFTSPTGRFRLVDRAWQAGIGEGNEITDIPEEILEVQISSPEEWELVNMVGPSVDFRAQFPGDGLIDYRPQHRDGARFVADTHQLVDRLAKRGGMDRLRDVLVADDLMDCGEVLTAALARCSREPQFVARPGRGSEFHRCLPTRTVFVDLRLLQIQDRDLPLEQHDLADLLALAPAFVHCDAVITERRWAHFGRRLNVAEGHGTAVFPTIEKFLETVG